MRISARLSIRAFLLAGFAFPIAAHAGDLIGTVTDPALSRPVEGATITVDGGKYTTTSGPAGRYRIEGISAGDHRIHIVQVGYRPYDETVAVAERGNTTADAMLRLADEDARAKAIVVTGSRASRLLALERKRALPVIADVVSSDLIGKLPDYNTAEALQRLPGVSVAIDQSEPRYVVIRGIDPNLNQVTVDGNLVGIPEAEGRRVALDTIPSALVASIEVIKAVTPDYDANAVGGSINIVTPTAFDRTDDFVNISARGDYNDKADKLGFGGSAIIGHKFGPDDQFGIAVGGSYSKRFIDSDLAEPINWAPITAGISTPTEYKLYDYRILRERVGAILNLDWRPNSGIRFYVRNIFNRFTDHEERDQVDFSIAGGTPTFPGGSLIHFPAGRASREFRQNNQTQKLYNISPGAELTFDQVTLELNYTYAHAEEHTPVRDDFEFRSAHDLDSTLDLSTSRPLFADFNPDLLDPAAFPLRRLRFRREQIDEDLNSAHVDATYDFGEDGGLHGFFKAGGKFIDRHKTRDNRQSQYERNAAITFADTGTALPPPEEFYDGEYRFGPRIDYGALLDYFEANPNAFALNEGKTLVNDLSSDYDIRERIYAGYGMAKLVFGDLSVIGGVRVEKTDGRYNAFAIRDTNGNGVLELSDLQPLTFDHDYTDVLPSVHLDYRPVPDLVLRAAWTNTIGRPNYDDSVPTFEEEDGEGEAGNPDLKPYKSLGLDFSAEYYPDAESIVSTAIFYKRLRNPIFTRTIQETEFAGIPLSSLSQPQNANHGHLLGIEANVQRRLTFLPAPLDGFGVSLNGTYVDSSVEVPGREDEDIPFFGQSNWLANAALFYEKGPLQARVAVAYRDDFIVNVGTSTASDVYDKNRTVLSAKVSYRVLEGVEVFGSMSNINKEPLTFYQTTPDQIYSRQTYSFTADFGVSASF